MSELLMKDQIMSVVPQDYRNSNKGKVLDIQDRTFTLEMLHAPDGILPKKLMEFYSQTKLGMLYFSASALEINGNVLTVTIPRKHRFLQRRSFTRIKFVKDVNLISDNINYSATTRDLSAGGLKLNTKEPLNINSKYGISIRLLGDRYLNCKFEPIKIEKNDDKTYTVSGRFDELENADKMKLMQFCMRKDIENDNK